MTRAGIGAELSPGIVLQPMSEALGWSRTSVSTAALFNCLGMRAGSLV